VAKPPCCTLSRDRRSPLCNGLLQGFSGACSNTPQVSLEFGERFLYWLQVGRRGRQKQQAAASGFNGLFAFALWCFIQALFDIEGEGRDIKGIIARAGYAVTGIANAALGFGGHQIVVGSGNGGRSAAANTQAGRHCC
jgi:hypothetical protein